MNNKSSYLIPEWPAPRTIQAYSTTRMHPLGHSKGPFSQFNLSLKVGDAEDAVIKNQQQLVDDLQLPETPRWLNQVHSNKVVDIVTQTMTPAADASFTTKKNTICAILSADCLPILLCNQQATEVAAIHAGWRGLLDRIIKNTINAMQSPPHELIAWLGPAIGPDIFVLNEQIKVDFLNNNPQNSDCFFVNRDNEILANIYQIANNELQRCDVNKIYGGTYCTFSDVKRFFSYRRDQQITGRMATLIWIKA